MINFVNKGGINTGVLNEINLKLEDIVGTPLAKAKTLEECTWEEIKQVSNYGVVIDNSIYYDDQQWFSIGDEKEITLSTNEKILVQIAGFQHDDKVTGGKAGITFVAKDCMNSKYRHWTTYNNSCGWSESLLRVWLTSTVLPTLPSDLAAVLSPVKKYTGAKAGDSTIISTDDTLFIPSIMEIFGTTGKTWAGEGTQYELFKDEATRIKKVNGTASMWWSRSPRSDYNHHFIPIQADGITGLADASDYLGVALSFCV